MKVVMVMGTGWKGTWIFAATQMSWAPTMARKMLRKARAAAGDLHERRDQLANGTVAGGAGRALGPVDRRLQAVLGRAVEIVLGD